MALYQVLFSLTGVTAATSLGVLMSPALDDTTRVPALGDSSLFVQSANVSAHFKSARVSEVLSWLEQKGFSYVAEDSQLPSGKTITLNVSNRSLNATADAVAAALGGHWEIVNGIHVYKRGDANLFGIPGGRDTLWMQGLPSMGTLNGDAFSKQFGPEFQKNLEKQFGPEFQKNLEKQFGPEFQKNLEKQFGPEFQKNMEKQFGPEFQKNLEKQFGPEFQKNLEKQFGPEFQKNLEKQFGPEFQENLEKQFGPEYQRKMEKMGEEFGKTQKSQSHGFGMKPMDEQKLLRSLTPDQRDKQGKQGYIWFNDLTPEQQEMFAGMPGKFDFRIKLEDQEVRVRRN